MSHKAHPIVVWELTRACDLNCRNCTFPATPSTARNELTTFESYKTIDQIALLAPKEFIMTGGDPLERSDVYELIDYARRRGLDPALVVSPTTSLTFDAISALQRNGLTRLIFSLDSSLPVAHDALHGILGGFGATTRAMRWARTMGFTIEVNTLITHRNATELPALVELLKQFSIARWNLYFLVPMGRATTIEVVTAEETEDVFASLYEIAQTAPFKLRTVEAPHYRRFVLQRSLDERLHDRAAWADFAGYVEGDDVADLAITGPNGYVYISHAGDVRASEFLPLSAGNVRYRSLSSVYEHSALFEAMRDPLNLRGKCAPCEFRAVCGGSRARAWATSGDLFGSDPLCAYHPGASSEPASGSATITSP